MRNGCDLPLPGPAWGPYPQRPDAAAGTGGLPAALAALAGATGLGALAERLAAPLRRRSRLGFLDAVRRSRCAVPVPGSQDWAGHLHRLRAELGRQGLAAEPLLAQALATVQRAAESALGRRAWDTQLLAARILLDNRLAEMATGEGKTLAAALAAATAALAGVPVQVITANPYLAARDAAALAPLYTLLGLRVAALVPGEAEAARRAAHAADIAYTTASELVFDYLRDRLDAAQPGAGAGTPRLRGLCMAIVDEADSVLIDEARTPFVLAQQQHDAAAERRHRAALALARGLAEGRHFRIDAAQRQARLLPAGRQACADALAAQPQADPLWQQPRWREELVALALTALHACRRDHHYLLRTDPRSGAPEVALIDAHTGRVAEGRRWQHGLQQLIELKEGLPPSPPQRTCAQLSYQRFFPRYWRLCGMSGTLREARTELRQLYRLPVERVPLRCASRRRTEAPRLYARGEARWHAVVAEVARLQAGGGAVLVGTDSVADALRLSRRLQQAGVEHQCLHARQDGDEAERIARAGQAGCVTVTTNLAGRGTDIVLGPGVAERGGLQLIACQANPSARIDRQLHGRCARAGDPGRVQTLLALDEGLLAERLPTALRRVLAHLTHLAPADRPLPGALARALLAAVQRGEERRARQQRAQLLQADRQLLRGLGFGALTE